MTLCCADYSLNTYLEVDDDEDDDDRGNQVGNVGCILPVERLLECKYFILLGQKEVEKGNDGALKLSSLLCANCDWRE